MKNLDLKITLAADNNIPAFGAFVNYFGKKKDREPRIMINFNATFSAIVENPGIAYKEFFSESVVHEMLHMVQGIFGQAFDEEEVESAIMRCRENGE